MKLVFVTEARFHKGIDGRIYSQNGSYGLTLWERYLNSFQKVIVVARVEITQKEFPKEYLAESDLVTFIELSYYVGPLEYLKKHRKIKKELKKIVELKNVAYICRVPGNIGTIFTRFLRRKSIPYAVEVVGDPWDVYAPRTIKHILSPFFRISSCINLKKVVANANVALYVNKLQLKKRYPCTKASFNTYASNVNIPDAAFESVPIKYSEDGYKPVKLIAIGSLAQMYKAPDIVLKAVKRLKVDGFDLNLKWLGDGIYKESMIKLAANLEISDIVDFVGNIPAGNPVRMELYNSDLFIHVSRTEGLPRAVIEAMSVGLACIGSKVGGIPELLDEIALISADNIDALVAKIKEFVFNPILMNKQGMRNFEVAKEYSASILMKRRQEFYGQIIQLSKNDFDFQ